MKREDLRDVATKGHLAEAAPSRLRGPQETHPHGHATSIRQASYKGHEIRIQTSYHITVDGEPVGGHVSVGNNGQVHYHSIPNEEFDSAVDMVKRLIELLPPDAEIPYAEDEG